MAMTHFLLQSNFQLHPTNNNNNNNNIALPRNCCIKTSPRFIMKCFIKSEEVPNEKILKKMKKIKVCENGYLWVPIREEASKTSSTQISCPAPTNGFQPSAYDLLLIFPTVLVSYFLVKWEYWARHSEETSILKLQVALLGTNTSLQRDLKRIVDTNKDKSYVLQETTLALLRHPDYYVYGYSSVDVRTMPREGHETRFNELSIDERIKFGTLNADNTKENNIATSQSSNIEYIVVTILVAAWGAWKLPLVRSVEELKNALQDLASIPSNYIKDVEVLWNPQHENSSLTEQELLDDYPLLNLI